jgi:hypothetical protein
MHFVVGKNGLNTRKKARHVVVLRARPFDAVVGHFCHNPLGETFFIPTSLQPLQV